MSQPDQRLLQWNGMESWGGQTMLSFVTATMRLQASPIRHMGTRWTILWVRAQREPSPVPSPDDV